MLTLLCSSLLAAIIAGAVYLASTNLVITIVVFVVTIGVANFLAGRYILKQMTALFSQIEKDLKAERFETAIEKLKSGYKFNKWQFFVKQQIDSQIGMILYLRKKFDESVPYLQNSFSKNWNALCMLAAQYYREKKMDKVKQVMDKAISSNKKEPFCYSLYAWFLSEQGQQDKAIEVLVSGSKKLPMDEKLESELDSLRNNKKIKIQNYGHVWMQLHLGKAADGARPYQALLANQRVKRR